MKAWIKHFSDFAKIGRPLRGQVDLSYSNGIPIPCWFTNLYHTNDSNYLILFEHTWNICLFKCCILHIMNTRIKYLFIQWISYLILFILYYNTLHLTLYKTPLNDRFVSLPLLTYAPIGQTWFKRWIYEKKSMRPNIFIMTIDTP
jgi:hypothetical protein